MGLDMYLYADAYIGRWDHTPPEERAKADSVLETADLTEFQIENAGVTVRGTVAYWRKANQIHSWFVRNVQEDRDDGGTYYVTTEHLENLHETCVLVLSSSEMVADMVNAGKVLSAETEWKWQTILEKGEVILDPKVAQNLLPTQEGFFFGSTDYDQWYIRDLVHTVEQLEPLIKHEPPPWFDFQYYASW